MSLINLLSGKCFNSISATRDNIIDKIKIDCHEINVAIAPAKKDDKPVPPNAPIDQKLNAFCLSSPSKKSLTMEIVAGMIIAADKPCTTLPRINNTTFPETISISEPTILSMSAIRVIFTLPNLSEMLPATTINTPVTNDVKLIEILTIPGLAPKVDWI